MSERGSIASSSGASSPPQPLPSSASPPARKSPRQASSNVSSAPRSRPPSAAAVGDGGAAIAAAPPTPPASTTSSLRKPATTSAAAPRSGGASDVAPSRSQQRLGGTANEGSATGSGLGSTAADPKTPRQQSTRSSAQPRGSAGTPVVAAAAEVPSGAGEPSWRGGEAPPLTVVGGKPASAAPNANTSAANAHRATALNQVVRREIAEAKLNQFYRDWAPDKLMHVQEIYDTYRDRLPDLFSQLLAKYPKCPRTTFDDVLALLQEQQRDGSSDGGASQVVANAVTQGGAETLATDLAAWQREVEAVTGVSRVAAPVAPTQPAGGGQTRVAFTLPGATRAAGNPQGTIGALLATGQALLEASPAQTAPTAHNPVVRAATQQADGYRRQLDDLETLVTENLKLAQKVAEAELAVLHERFRVLLARCLHEPGGLGTHISDETYVEIEDSQHIFRVPASQALWCYIREGLFRAPLPGKYHGARLCSVTGKGLYPLGDVRVEVDSNLTAAAMREWERQVPHTVLELKPQAVATWMERDIGERSGVERVDEARSRQEREAAARARAQAFRSYVTGAVVWWSWPTTTQRRNGVAAQSLFSGAQDGSDAAIANTLLQPLLAQPTTSEVVGTLGIAADVSSSMPGYWSHVVNHFDAVINELRALPPHLS